MAWTRYYNPRAVAYYSESGTGWVDTQGGFSTYRNLIMVDGLVGTATSGGGIITSDARALLLTDFGIPQAAGTLGGIEVVTEIERNGRVIDQTLQLYQGELIGENRARDSVTNLQIYGGSTDLWGTTDVNYTATDFGIVLDLRPSALLPSNERPIIRDIRLRIYSA